jgi:hypothetical protein
MQRGASSSEFGRTCILISRQKRLEQYEHLDRSAYWRWRRSPSCLAWSWKRPHKVGATRRPPPPDAQNIQSRRTGALGRQPPHLSEANAHCHFTAGRCQLAGLNYRAAWFLDHAYRRSGLRPRGGGASRASRFSSATSVTPSSARLISFLARNSLSSLSRGPSDEVGRSAKVATNAS